jgi:hypothetical protein
MELRSPNCCQRHLWVKSNMVCFLPLFHSFQENISITREEFVHSVKELNLFVNPVGLHAIEYEYTDWMDPDNSTKMISALDKMVGDYQFTCPVIEFADA